MGDPGTQSPSRRGRLLSAQIKEGGETTATRGVRVTVLSDHLQKGRRHLRNVSPFRACRCHNTPFILPGQNRFLFSHKNNAKGVYSQRVLLFLGVFTMEYRHRKGIRKYRCDACNEFTWFMPRELRSTAGAKCAACGSRCVSPHSEGATDAIRRRKKLTTERADLKSGAAGTHGERAGGS